MPTAVHCSTYNTVIGLPSTVQCPGGGKVRTLRPKVILYKEGGVTIMWRCGCNVCSLIHLQLEADEEKTKFIDYDDLEDYYCISSVSKIHCTFHLAKTTPFNACSNVLGFINLWYQWNAVVGFCSVSNLNSMPHILTEANTQSYAHQVFFKDKGLPACNTVNFQKIMSYHIV